MNDTAVSSVDQFKGGFFDRKAVRDALGAAGAKALASSAAQIRKVSQRSMRRRKGTSPAGSPPFAHKDSPRGSLLRDLLFFAFDTNQKSAVVGPVQLGRSVVKSLHEFGGRTKHATFPKRPFMKPALDQEIPNIAKKVKM